ncbi:MAG: SDR family oxidoreductase [Candidatus Levybacteria bacterium]|nr:SDR family oxidoreductase [Candidatus Levybacteria bacterium]
MRKVVLITGASSGLGKEIAKLFQAKDYVLILSGRNEKGFEDFDSPNIEKVIGDITLKETRNKLVDLVRNKYKRLDILINNAGIGLIQPFEENTEEQLDKILEINLKAPILLTQALYDTMKMQQSGTIVIINSTSGKQGYPNHTLYATTKFGLSGFAQSLRQEAKMHNIRVISIHSGGIKTNLYNKLSIKPDLSKYMDPTKVAEIVVYLSETSGLSPDEIVINRITK